MTKKLVLGSDLALPLDAVTHTFGLLAVRGAGKSNAAAVMAEAMYAASLPFVVVDPVGSWWGLRSSADGTAPGLAIPIFGGKHGDVPLERGGGKLVADLVVQHRMSCVLDLSEFESEAAKKGFLLDFAVRLYRTNTEPLHLFLEEADDYIPQRPMRDETHLLRAWENIVRRGRARGLGVTFITQRSAAINKNVLTQVETLITLRTTGPQDRKAIEEWVKYNHESTELLSSLASLKPGEAWVWSPTLLGRVQRTQFARRATFDSASTPKMRKGARPATTLADVDLGGIRTAMADTIERAEENDPARLQREIIRLEKELRTRPVVAPEKIEVPVLSAESLGRMEEAVGQLADMTAPTLQAIRDTYDRVEDAIRHSAKLLEQARSYHPKIVFAETASSNAGGTFSIMREPEPVRAPRVAATTNAEGLPKGERSILTALAQNTEAGRSTTRDELTVLTGYKRSTRDAYMQRLEQRQYITSSRDGWVATEEGLAELGDFTPLPTGAALRQYWLNRLPAGETIVLSTVVEEFPASVSREQITVLTGYKRSTRDAYIQRLATRRLVKTTGQGIIANETLF